MGELLEIDSLEVSSEGRQENITIIKDISFSLKAGETVGIVGESGCGKSITSLSILGLLEKPLSITGGEISFNGKILSSMNDKELRKICGKEIGMIFQEPMTALNPMFTVGKQLEEPLRINLKMSKKEAYDKSLDLLKDVGIKDPNRVLNCYPHQLSGGMRQRIIIAIAISCRPMLLIADEPTTALDVTVQAQVLEIIDKLVKKNEMSLLLVSHDLGVISQMSERVIVMYAGEIVEEDKVENIINRPQHPYTKKLVNAAKELLYLEKNLTVVKGSVPRPEEEIRGCRFALRCEERQAICLEKSPSMDFKSHGGKIKCWNCR